MKLISCLSVLAVAICVTCCSPNRSILLDKTNDTNAVVDQTPEPPLAPPTKITVAELMDRVANAPPDAFLFPCTLGAYSESERNDLRRLREEWLKKEDDARYRVSPTNCVCPGICVIEVEDTQRAAPANASLLVIDQSTSKKISWLAKNIDLRNSRLGWDLTEPQITFSNADGSKKFGCVIRIDSKSNRPSSSCSDGHKTFPPLESR